MDEKLQSNVNANTSTMNTKLGPKGYTLLKKELWKNSSGYENN